LLFCWVGEGGRKFSLGGGASGYLSCEATHLWWWWWWCLSGSNAQCSGGQGDGNW